jgi:multiple sugar transport system permease protein
MSITQQVLPAGSRLATVAVKRRARTSGLYGSEHIWAIAFALPYVFIFFAFVLYPIVYGLWMGSDPALYRQLFDDPRYLTAVINTLLSRVLGPLGCAPESVGAVLYDS